MTRAVQAGVALLGQPVRWAHEPEAAPTMRVTAVQHDGMVALDILPGWFAPSLFRRLDAEAAADR